MKTPTRTLLRTLSLMTVLGLSAAGSASAYSGGITVDTAPVPESVTNPTVPGATAKILPNGLAAAPALAPEEVKRAIWRTNRQVIGKRYKWGGGHGRFNDTGYDCSGTVSYALNGARALKRPLDSSSLMRWGNSGKGDWITVYTNPGHAFVVIAGIRLDTSAAGDVRGNKGPRWRPLLRSTRGFKVRHPKGL